MCLCYSIPGIDIELQSYACDDRLRGNNLCFRPEVKSWIKIGGKDAIRTKRGWNIVVINHMTGAIEASRNFDTAGLRKANHDMKAWVRGIRNKRIIVGVAHVDYGRNLDHRGIETLVSTAYVIDASLMCAFIDCILAHCVASLPWDCEKILIILLFLCCHRDFPSTTFLKVKVLF